MNYLLLTILLILGCVVAWECRKAKRIGMESNQTLIRLSKYHDSFCEGYLFAGKMQGQDSIFEQEESEGIKKHRIWAKACRNGGPADQLLSCASWHRREADSITARREIGSPTESSMSWSDRIAKEENDYADALAQAASRL